MSADSLNRALVLVQLPRQHIQIEQVDLILGEASYKVVGANAPPKICENNMYHL
jgi:hypothetical protein